MSFIDRTLQELEQKELRRKGRDIDGPQGRIISLNGKMVLNFCSNDYLGLAGDPALAAAARQAMDEEGFGAGASRLVCGNMRAHRRLEEKTARFKGTESALVFSTGYMANAGIIPAVCGRDDLILSDRFNHASIIDGIILSGAKWRRYSHRDMNALERLLRDNAHYPKKLIVTDSVFSMDGDIAPLDEITALAKTYGALVMVDEAHGLGVLGKHGKGAAEHFGVEGAIDFQMGTFSKAAGAFGAYCCGKKETVEFLMNKARSFIYTTGMPPAVAAAAVAGLEMIENQPFRREELWRKVERMTAGLKEQGWDLLNTQTPIIPVVVGEAKTAVEFSERLLEEGIFAAAIRPPTVPAGTARLQLTVTAAHTGEDVEMCLSKIGEVGKRLCLI